MKKQIILIIGSGGREHALGWKLAQSKKVSKIYFAPGNAGTAQLGENVPISALDIPELVKFATTNKIDLTVVGPDDALALGVVNAFQKKKLLVFGPTQKAAQIEASKAFSKQLMKDADVPTAKYEAFTDAKKAKAYLDQQTFPLVIKASGLALGKGVIIAQTKHEAEQSIEDMMVKKVFGAAGDKIVIEEFLQGQEISIHAFCDGDTYALFPTARDHKPIFDGNKGPNTGGMGTIAPLQSIKPAELKRIGKTIVEPIIKTMKKQGIPFSGLLYPGLMMTKDGPKVLEFNARFGDPETQSYMRLLKTDLFDILMSCAKGQLAKQKVTWAKKAACCIVIASKGYPESSQKGIPIHGLEKIAKLKDVVVFHAGTKLNGDETVTNGGRVLGITAIGENLDKALQLAYKQIGKTGIHFDGMQYRKDIGKIK